MISLFFFFNDTATTEIYTLSLPTLFRSHSERHAAHRAARAHQKREGNRQKHAYRREQREGNLFVPLHRQSCDVKADRKSTRLNSSHSQISYAVFCLKKKKSK